MLDIFLNQQATKVIVGDTHQQIYSWRYAINSLEKTTFQTYQLSASFRFSQSIADLAMEALSLKKLVGDFDPVTIKGHGNSTTIHTKAVLARTNLGLLLKAIEYVTEKQKVQHIYFEGNINSYTYADEGASLYDVLNLYNHKHFLIRDSLIKAMKDLAELEDYIDKTEDVQLSMMVEIVKKYGNEIPGIIKKIKDKHVENNDKEKAEMIFSTVHRCKGMEYDAVHLVNDFITEEKIEKLKADSKKSPLNEAKINEEINLLYVAITRTKNALYIPEALVPETFPESPQIHIITAAAEAAYQQSKQKRSHYHWANDFEEFEAPLQKAYSVEVIRQTTKAAYRPWTTELDDELTIMFCEGKDITTMARHFERSNSAIKSRIKKLELEDLYGFGA
jgi:superfamily I DNA/RNA helicase